MNRNTHALVHQIATPSIDTPRRRRVARRPALIVIAFSDGLSIAADGLESASRWTGRGLERAGAVGKSVYAIVATARGESSANGELTRAAHLQFEGVAQVAQS